MSQLGDELSGRRPLWVVSLTSEATRLRFQSYWCPLRETVDVLDGSTLVLSVSQLDHEVALAASPWRHDSNPFHSPAMSRAVAQLRELRASQWSSPIAPRAEYNW